MDLFTTLPRGHFQQINIETNKSFLDPGRWAMKLAISVEQSTWGRCRSYIRSCNPAPRNSLTTQASLCLRKSRLLFLLIYQDQSSYISLVRNPTTESRHYALEERDMENLHPSKHGGEPIPLSPWSWHFAISCRSWWLLESYIRRSLWTGPIKYE